MTVSLSVDDVMTGIRRVQKKSEGPELGAELRWTEVSSKTKEDMQMWKSKVTLHLTSSVKTDIYYLKSKERQTVRDLWTIMSSTQDTQMLDVGVKRQDLSA